MTMTKTIARRKPAMAAKIYWALQTHCRKCKPQALLTYLQQRVAKENWADVVTHVRIEKGLRDKGEYYFYLGIDTTVRSDWQQQLTNWLKTLPEHLRVPKEYKGQDFSWEEIRPMVGTAHDLAGCTQSMVYVAPAQPLRLHPLVLEVPAAFSSGDRTAECEKLMGWLGAAGEGSWEKFQAVCEVLGLTQPRRLLRRLRLLGHLTVRRDGQRWRMNPPSLQPLGGHRFLVYGQRNAALGAALKRHGRLEEIPQPNGDGPAGWHFEPHTDIAALLAALQTDFPALAVRPVALPPLWADWVAQFCQEVEGVPVYRYDLRRFNGKEFEAVPIAADSGLYELRDDRSAQTLFYDGKRWYSGEWYGLRFWALTHLMPAALTVTYDRPFLGIPVAQRWPIVYERYLVMQSGCLPQYDREQEGLIYRDIAPAAVQAVMERLPVAMEPLVGA